MSVRQGLGLVLKFLVLLIGFREVLGWQWMDLIRATREDTDFDAMNNISNTSNETTTTTFSTTTETTTMATPTPILTPDAIANIVLSGVAVIFLTAVLCYLMITFNQVEHHTRVRTALQRNKQIDRQIAAARARQQQQLKLKEQEELIGEEGLKVETVGGAAEDGRRLVPAAVGVVNDGETPSSNGDQESVRAKDASKTGGGVTSEVQQGIKAEVVVDFEDKGSGTSSASLTVDDDDKPLISIGGGDTPPNQQPVLLVKPAQPELV